MMEASGKPDTTPASHRVAKEREAGWGDYFRCFTYAQKRDFVLMAGAAVASIGAGVTLPLMNIIFGRLAANFTSFAEPSSSTSQAALQSTINTQCLYVFILFLARFALNYLSKFTLRLIGLRLSAALRTHYLTTLLSLPIHALDTLPPGAAAATITSSANTVQIGLSEKLGTLVEGTTQLITALVVAFVYSWRLTLVTLSCVVFTTLMTGIVFPFILRATARSTREETRASAVATEAFAAVRVVYAYGAQQRMVQRYGRHVHEARRLGAVTAPLLALQFAGMFFGMYNAFPLCFWYGMTRSGDGVAAILVVLMDVFLMAVSLERMSSPLLAASKAAVAAASFFVVIDAPKPVVGRQLEAGADGDVVLERVTFAYPGRPSAMVLDGLTMRIEAGKVTAIVGPSGSGKSTIVGLVEKWYSLHEEAVIEQAVAKDEVKKRKMAEKKKNEKKKKKLESGGKKSSFWTRFMPQSPSDDDIDDDGTDIDIDTAKETQNQAMSPVPLSGKITASGINLDDINVKWWRSQIGLVQQEPFLFNQSIYENVMNGLVGTQWEDEPLDVKQGLVREACKEAFADEFIDKMPLGYETLVGEQGLKLSGGQRQRIAIARSIVKKPKILILDEATSAIDVRGEKIIQAALDRVSKGRTTIMIAHRLSTIAKADCIVVMQKGKVMEQGTHEQLLADQEGVYSALVRAQQLNLGMEKEAEMVDKQQEDVTVGAEDDEDNAMAKKNNSNFAKEQTDMSALDTSWKPRGLVGSFGRLLSEQRRHYPQYLLTVAFAAIVASGLSLQAYLFAQAINVFTLGGDAAAMAAAVSFWALMWFVLAVGVAVGYFGMVGVAVSAQYALCAVYRVQYFTALMRQRVPFFDCEGNGVGALASRVQGDPKQLEELLGLNMAMVINAVLQLMGSFIISFAFNWKIALVSTFVSIPLGFVCAYFRYRYEIGFEKMSAAVFAESSQWAAEAISAFRTVSSLTLESSIIARYRRLLRGHISSASRRAPTATAVLALSDSLSLACNALVLWYGGHLLARGETTVVRFFVCYMAVLTAGESAGSCFSFGPNAAQVTGAANRILSVRESVGEQQQDMVMPGKEIEKQGGEDGVKIELRNVGFAYPGREKTPVFTNLNLTIEQGQFAALVGASGAGKSSIISLLERFYDVSSGQILANDVDIATLDVHTYRQQLALVAQEPTLFQGTLRENILLGVDDSSSSTTNEALHTACQAAAIHDFIVSLPEGYDTNVGARGVALSGGQKQRVAIARALVRRPRLLLLDEATSALDSESEKAITAALGAAIQGNGMTVVAVAHRLATIQAADVIFVVGEGGAVVEKGTHEELVRRRGLYYNMCQSQALDR